MKRVLHILAGVVFGVAVMAGLIVLDVMPNPFTPPPVPDIQWGIRTFPQDTP